MRGLHQLALAKAWYRGATFMKFGRAAAIRWMFFWLKEPLQLLRWPDP
jgi:hypothetical protein